jgi:hypothetical protein
MEQKYIDRFHTKYEKKENGCWEWTDAKDKSGYGYYRAPTATAGKAHRFSALIAGLDITQPVIRHLCNNPSCVNPDHLRAGSVKDNSDDKVAASRQPMGITNGRAKLTEQQVLEIRAKYIPWTYSTTMLAKEYGVSSVMISDIVNKRNWKHI